MDDTRPDIKIIDRFSDAYGEVSSLIRMVYCRKYGAFLPEIYSQLVVVFNKKQPVAALGFRPAIDQKLFLECYLNDNIEHYLQAQDSLLSRSDIVEIGHMVSTIKQGSWELIAATASYLLDEHYQWVVFTATSDVRKIFLHLGVELHFIAHATSSALRDQEAQQAWGTYYESQPAVVAAGLQQMLLAVSEHVVVTKADISQTTIAIGREAV